MWTISFILGRRTDWKKIFYIINGLNNKLNLTHIVFNVDDLTSPSLKRMVLKITNQYPESDIIVKELIRDDFFGGLLSTIQLFDEGKFMLIDGRAVPAKVALNKLPLNKRVVVTLSRRWRKNRFKLDLELDENNLVKLRYYRRGSRLWFYGIFIYNTHFIDHVKKMLLLYYNPDFIKFENSLNSYVYRGNEVYGVLMD